MKLLTQKSCLIRNYDFKWTERNTDISEIKMTETDKWTRDVRLDDRDWILRVVVLNNYY